MKTTSNTIHKRVKALPPPSFGIVPVPLELLPAYYEMWKIEPIAGSWRYVVSAHDYVLDVAKVEAGDSVH
jgi:hypothetical protein